MEEEKEGKGAFEFHCESKITGKLVRVRHAVEADRVYIQEKLKELRLDSSRVNFRQYVVADEDGVVIGFGTMKKVVAGIVHMSLFVDARQGYLSELMVKHLIKYPPGD